eukprot:c20074_g1_i1 orf=399-1271(-)
MILKFKFLVRVIERDFRIRYQVFQATQNMDLLTESFLSQIFKGPSRKILLTQLLHLTELSEFYKEDQEICSIEKIKYLKFMSARAGSMGLTNFCSSIQSLILMLMDFDLEYRKKLESSPKKFRQNKQWFFIWDLIIEIVGCETSLLASLLQVMDEPHDKLKIIFNYFIENAPQPVVKEMREKPGSLTVQDFLNCFVRLKDVKSTYKRIETDVLQLLLANSFKVFLMQRVYSKHCTAEIEIDAGLLGVCRSLVTAFENLQTVSSDFELHSAGREALISAETICAYVDLAKR